MPGRENHISMWAYGFRLTRSRTEQGRRLHGLGFKSLTENLPQSPAHFELLATSNQSEKNICRPFPSSSTLACFLTESKPKVRGAEVANSTS